MSLVDDAAAIVPPAGHDLVLKADAIVGGTHFFPDDPPGAIARKASVEISHELLRNLKISGLASYQVTSYQGQNLSTAYTGSSTGINERVVNATVKAEYSLTRTVVVKASYTYERLKTTVPGSDYTSNIFLLGLRLQR